MGFLVGRLFCLQACSIPFIPRRSSSIYQRFLYMRIFSIRRYARRQGLSYHLNFRMIFRFHMVSFCVYRYTRYNLRDLQARSVYNIKTTGSVFSTRPINGTCSNSRVSEILCTIWDWGRQNEEVNFIRQPIQTLRRNGCVLQIFRRANFASIVPFHFR